MMYHEGREGHKEMNALLGSVFSTSDIQCSLCPW